MARREPAPPEDGGKAADAIEVQSVRDVTPPTESTGPEETPAEDTPPPYYIATAPLFIGDQFGRAFNAGDRVPAEHVDRYGWAHLVHRPDEDPQQPPAAPADEPETAPGQATSKEGDA